VSDPSKQVIEACVTALCGAESQGLREKVLAVIRAYDDAKRIERRSRGALACDCGAPRGSQEHYQGCVITRAAER
jgi:hypothetical protein